MFHVIICLVFSLSVIAGDHVPVPRELLSQSTEDSFACTKDDEPRDAGFLSGADDSIPSAPKTLLSKRYHPLEIDEPLIAKRPKALPDMEGPQLFVISPSQPRATTTYESLHYIQLPEREIDEYLELLDTLPSGASTDYSFVVYSEEMRRVGFDSLKKTPVKAFIPLFKMIVARVLEQLPVDKELFHLAIRVDPTMERVRRNCSRKQTSEWHDHDRDNYLFTLTRDERLTTDLRVKRGDDDAFEFNMKKNQIMLLPKFTKHKTPRPRKGRRIQLNIGVEPAGTWESRD